MLLKQFALTCLTVLYTGSNKLFHIVYEKGKVKKNALEPHLWSYHPKISLEHLGQTLLGRDLTRKCPILYEFLQVVSHCILRALKDNVKL